MPLSNAEQYYFDSLLDKDIKMYSERAEEAAEAFERAEVKTSPYADSQAARTHYSRGVTQGLRLARELLEKAQT